MAKIEEVNFLVNNRSDSFARMDGKAIVAWRHLFRAYCQCRSAIPDWDSNILDVCPIDIFGANHKQNLYSVFGEILLISPMPYQILLLECHKIDDFKIIPQLLNDSHNCALNNVPSILFPLFPITSIHLVRLICSYVISDILESLIDNFLPTLDDPFIKSIASVRIYNQYQITVERLIVCRNICIYASQLRNFESLINNKDGISTPCRYEYVTGMYCKCACRNDAGMIYHDCYNCKFQSYLSTPIKLCDACEIASKCVWKYTYYESRCSCYNMNRRYVWNVSDIPKYQWLLSRNDNTILGNLKST